MTEHQLVTDGLITDYRQMQWAPTDRSIASRGKQVSAVANGLARRNRAVDRA